MPQINRVERLIINLDTAMALSCAWDDCPKRARTPYQVRAHEHPPHWNCHIGRHSVYAFCSESCKDYWLACMGVRAEDTAARNRGLVYGQHSAGMRGRL